MIFSCKFLRVCALPVPAEGDSSAGRALSPASVRSEPACSTDDQYQYDDHYYGTNDHYDDHDYQYDDHDDHWRLYVEEAVHNDYHSIIMIVEG